MSLTHSQLKARPAWVRDQAEFKTFIERKTRGLPSSFAGVIGDEWNKIRASDPLASARWGFGVLRQIQAAQALGICPDASDGELCRKAESEARQMSALLDAVQARVHKLKAHIRDAVWVGRLVVKAKAWAVRLDMRRRGVEDRLPQGKHITHAGIVARATDPVFWRRILRGLHAKLLEGVAISLGLVHAGRRDGCYVSKDSLKRRAGQRARNAAALASTVAVNDKGEGSTLADIAARGVANGEVRRAELMTRISGFEQIANDLGHKAMFVTVTCPSRMHKWKRGARESTPNNAYDGTLPNVSQAYLAAAWAKFRAAAARRGLAIYGFRIAEPHHDGCPHWHMLLWFGHAAAIPGDTGEAIHALLLRYFLYNDSPDEPGAQKYRVKVERIDPAKGSAVSYVAKYVAKNIDGYKVGSDLYGNPALESSARVEAWASTWRIRQFQQIGGAPVGVWRELRRVHPGNVPMEAPQVLHDALMMVNVSGVDAIMGGPESEQDEAQRIRAGWAAYTMAQGGPTAKRKAHTMRVLRDETGEANRYGELGSPRVAGVAASSWEKVTFGIVTTTRARADQVESERSTWVTSTFKPEDGGSMARVVRRLTAVMDARQAQIDARKSARGNGFGQSAGQTNARGAFAAPEAVTPWTRVNNCTDQGQTIGQMLGLTIYRTPKVGQVFKWNGGTPNQLKASNGKAYSLGDPGRHQVPSRTSSR